MNCTNGKYFVDTNIILYAFDRSSDRKHEIAGRIMETLWNNRIGILSPQVLQELFVTATKKIPRPLSIDEAYRLVENLSRWELVQPAPRVILKAIEIHRQHCLSFWDALILSSAIHGKANVLMSEDLQHGFRLEMTEIVNPFL